MAQCFLDLHIGGDLVQRHMARSFDHYLNIFRPGALRQFAKSDQFLDLRGIGSVRQTARTAGVSQAQRDIILSADIQDFVKMLIEGVLFPCHFHPGKHDGTASGYNIHKTLIILEAFCRSPVHAAVDRHEIHSVFRVHPHNVDPFL